MLKISPMTLKLGKPLFCFDFFPGPFRLTFYRLKIAGCVRNLCKSVLLLAILGWNLALVQNEKDMHASVKLLQHEYRSTLMH